ncbi:MAG: hypothetical protein WD030_05170 [Pirellulales bacterium]
MIARHIAFSCIIVSLQLVQPTVADEWREIPHIGKVPVLSSNSEELKSFRGTILMGLTDPPTRIDFSWKAPGYYQFLLRDPNGVPIVVGAEGSFFIYNALSNSVQYYAPGFPAVTLSVNDDSISFGLGAKFGSGTSQPIRTEAVVIDLPSMLRDVPGDGTHIQKIGVN